MSQVSVNFAAEGNPAGSGVTSVTWTQTLTQVGWVASTPTLAGQKIKDSNGNLQTAQNAGTTGSPLHPTWNVTLGGPTSDNGTTWINGGSTVNVISPGDIVWVTLLNRTTGTGSPVTGITDSAGFSNWTQLSSGYHGSYIFAGAAIEQDVWYATATSAVASGGSFSITPTFATPTGNFDFIMGVISGITPSSPIQTADVGFGVAGPSVGFTVGPVQPGSLTVPNNSFMIAVFSHDYTQNAPPSGWTPLVAAGNGFDSFYNLVAVGAAENPGVTINVPGSGDYAAWSASQTTFVTAPTLVSIAVTPTSPSIALGLTQQFTAIGTYSDSSTLDITASSVWASSDTSKATINASTGLATGVGVGTTNITATKSSITSNLAILTVTLFSISGNAGVAGALVSWTGTSSGNVTADGSGNFSITSLTPGTFTITPTLSGYHFSPTNQSETISSVNITGVNFTAIADTWSISGNAGVAAAVVSYSGTASGSVVADGSGNYSIPSLTNGVYLLTPSLPGYHFTPPTQTKTVLNASIANVNFTFAVNPPPPPSKEYIPLPFTQRTSCAVAVFACLGVAAPGTILRTLTSSVSETIALQLEYGQLFQIYNVLRRQDIVNQRAVLVAAVATALGIVTNLAATVDSMSASGDNASVLAGLQAVVSGALTQIQNVQFDEQ